MGEYIFFVTHISIQQLEYTIELVKSTFKKREGVHELHESVFDQQSMLLLLKKELSSYSIFDFMKVQAFFDNFKSILSNKDSQNQPFDMEQYQKFLKWSGTKLADTHEVPQMAVLYYFSDSRL